MSYYRSFKSKLSGHRERAQPDKATRGLIYGTSPHYKGVRRYK